MGTKLKDLRKMKIWEHADIIRIYDTEGNEIEITSETKRRTLDNKEVVSWEPGLKHGLATLDVVLDV